MQKEQFRREVEKLIAEHQKTQSNNPPSSSHWRNASNEINRLARIITDCMEPVEEERDAPSWIQRVDE